MSTQKASALLVHNGNLVTSGRKYPGGGLFARDGRIVKVFKNEDEVARFRTTLKESEVGKREEMRIIDAGGDYIAPGFVDIHCHGGGGYDFMDGTVEAIVGAGKMHLSHGTTCLFPTTLASTTESLERAIKSFQAAKHMDQGLPEFPGLHLEGPYFSMAQRGAQDPKHIRNPDPAEYRPFLKYAKDIARWTLAPELPGALQMARELKAHGILPAIGHSDADYDQVLEGWKNGFSLVTHLYSGMSIVHRIHGWRHAGVVESAYLIDDMAVEVIADGCHLPESLLRLICKIKKPEKICLVTDAMRAAGLPEGEYLLGGKEDGQKAIVRDGVAWTADASAFAGSVTTAERLVRTMVKLAGVSVERAVEMASASPAKVMGVFKRKGSIAAGKDADIVCFDEKFSVKAVVARGSVEVCKYR
jgi:N-acetylglucosamine-6-phosphate deacetylase